MPGGVGDRPDPRHQRLERLRPVLLGAEQQPDQVSDVAPSAEPWQMMSELRTPRRPIVRDVVPPEVQLVADALLREQGGEALRALQRAGRVLPLALPADEQQADAAAQPLEVVAAGVLEVVDRVVEVRRLAALAPRVPGGRVVVARQAEREREEVGALEREVDRVVGAEADAERRDLLLRPGSRRGCGGRPGRRSTTRSGRAGGRAPRAGARGWTTRRSRRRRPRRASRGRRR